MLSLFIVAELLSTVVLPTYLLMRAVLERASQAASEHRSFPGSLGFSCEQISPSWLVKMAATALAAPQEGLRFPI